MNFLVSFKQTINRRLSSSKRILNSKQTIFGCFRKQNNDSNKYKSLRVSLSQKIADAISLSPQLRTLSDHAFRYLQSISREGNHLLSLLIPHFETKARKTFHDCERHFCLQRRNGIVTLLEVVVGDSGAQMMDMVVADVAGKPTQDRRQFVK